MTTQYCAKRALMAVKEWLPMPVARRSEIDKGIALSDPPCGYRSRRRRHRRRSAIRAFFALLCDVYRSVHDPGLCCGNEHSKR